MVLFCFPLWGAHFDICGVVAPPHRATVFYNPIQAVEDTLTRCKVLTKNEKQDKQKIALTQKRLISSTLNIF